MWNFALPLFDAILELSAAMEGKMGEDKSEVFSISKNSER